jgi:hypothetical protein
MSIKQVQSSDSSDMSFVSNAFPRLIGQGSVVRKGLYPASAVCTIKIGHEDSDDSDVPFTVFKAYVPEIKKSIGKCKFEILEDFPDCVSRDYCTKKVVFIRDLDSFNRQEYQGVGTLLLQATIEYGISQGTEGRVALYSISDAIGFYYKLGMRNGFRDVHVDRQIKAEIDQAARENRPPKNILEDEALLMYLSSKAIAVWKHTIQDRRVLCEQFSSS